MSNPPVPFERLRLFVRELNLDEDHLAIIDRYRDSFLSHKQEFSEFLYGVLFKFSQTSIVFERQTTPERLKLVWGHWFERLWTHSDEDDLLASVWRSGMTHVRLGIDHRFISLGYAQVRRFCRGMVAQAVPPNEHVRVMEALDRLIDVSILVETDAFITGGAKCAREVIMGVAHQIRNPIMVIGGFASRLNRQRTLQSASVPDSIDAILKESRRIQRMVEYAVAYMEIMDREPVFEEIELLPALQEALEKASALPGGPRPEVRLDISPSIHSIEGDRVLLAQVLLHVLHNSFDAVAPEDPWIRVTAKRNPRIDSFASLEIVNSGQIPPGERPEALFDPFHSTKPYGTGLGLPMALLAARKMFGTVSLTSLPGEGTLCTVSLPLPGTIDPSGLAIKA
jgi:signal transduction histidine kinase